MKIRRSLESVVGRDCPSPHLRNSFDDAITAMAGDIAMMETPVLISKRYKRAIEVFATGREWVWGVQPRLNR